MNSENNLEMFPKCSEIVLSMFKSKLREGIPLT